MLSFYLTQCTDCGNLESALCAVEGALAQYGKDAWQNLTYMTQKPVPNVQVKKLIYYREILNNLKWDQSFYFPHHFQVIVSRAQRAAGSITPIAKRWKLPVYTTTTTTSTSSTTTSSTSSTTSTTSTSTTSTSSSTTTTTTT